MKKVVVIAIITLYSISANAQELNFKVTVDDLNLIQAGLDTQPFGKVLPLVNKLRSQFIEQQPKPEVKPEPPKDDKKDASPQDK